MTTYTFRMKLESDPTGLWRDVHVGADRSIDAFQTVFNDAVGLDQAHLWFVGTDQDYWHSDLQYKHPDDLEQSTGRRLGGPEEHDATETTVGQMVSRMGLGEGDRIYYLFDYGDEWRFYGILKEIDEDGSSQAEPTVVKRKGDPVDQYAPPGER